MTSPLAAAEQGTMVTIPRNWLLVVLGLAVLASVIAIPAAAGPAENGARPTKAVSVTLYGSTTGGWGYGPANISSPGPSFTVDQGDVITFTLFAQDSQPHTLVIDLDSDGVKDTGEEESAQFSSPSTGVPFTYTANTAGTIQYYCGMHGTTPMRGTLTVRSAASPGDNTLLIVGGVVGVVVVVAVAAMMMRKKKPGP